MIYQAPKKWRKTLYMRKFQCLDLDADLETDSKEKYYHLKCLVSGHVHHRYRGKVRFHEGPLTYGEEGIFITVVKTKGPTWTNVFKTEAAASAFYSKFDVHNGHIEVNYNWGPESIGPTPSEKVYTPNYALGVNDLYEMNRPR